jgi:uncharacterized protein YhbP (UPF0306 family)
MRIVIERIVKVSPQHAPLTLGDPDKRRFTEPRIKRSIIRLLNENVLCSMSTLTKGNRAHINTAYFCFCANLELYFLSDPAALHCLNLKTNPSMAMAVYSSLQHWGHPDRGIQLFGACRESNRRQAMKAEQLYGKRFPAFRKWMAERETAGTSRISRYRFYRFVPRQVKILDESQFGGGVFVIAAVRRGREQA